MFRTVLKSDDIMQYFFLKKKNTNNERIYLKSSTPFVVTVLCLFGQDRVMYISMLLHWLIKKDVCVNAVESVNMCSHGSPPSFFFIEL